MSHPSPAAFRTALAAHQCVDMPALPGRRNDRLTGVLLPLVWRPDPVCIATVRARSLSQHAGEVCFPGGRPDAADVDLRATALREAHEELGIHAAEILGELSSIPLYTSEYRLKPFVARIDEQRLRPNPDEVAAVLHFTLAELLARPHVDAIGYQHEGVEGLSPVFASGEHLMFGATAHCFYELLVVAAPLFGCEAPPLEKGRYSWRDVLPAELAPRDA